MNLIKQYKIPAINTNRSHLNEPYSFERVPSWIQKIISDDSRSLPTLLVSEYESHLKASLPLPGLIKDTLIVEFKDGKLSINGKYKLNKEEGFQYVFDLSLVQSFKYVSTDYKDGIMYFKLNSNKGKSNNDLLKAN